MNTLVSRLAAVSVVGAALLFGAVSCRDSAPPPSGAARDVSGPPIAPAARAPATPASAPAPEAFECRWTDEPITLDGKGDEKAWANAQVIDHFTIPWLHGADAKAKTATKARLLWDREYLYFLAEMEDTDLYADVTEHQGEVWNNDAFELFFKPADDKPGYYEFEVSPANTTLELFFPSRNSGGYPRFKSDRSIKMETAVALRGTLNHWQDVDQGWTVEGRIRWRDLAPTGGRPNVDESWKFALCRVDFSVGIDGPELTSSAPLTRPSFHQYEDYSQLKFVGPPTTAADAPRPYGIEKRVEWTTSHVVGAPDPPLPYTVTKAFPNLKIKQPLYVKEEPGTDQLIILQHLGPWTGPSRLVRMKNDPNAADYQTLLDVNRLAYGFTLHPDFLHNGYLYLFSDGPLGIDARQARVSRYTVARTPPYAIDPASEKVILEWDSAGHDGGDLGFGPDGNLYFTTGDGSTDSDANLRGQDITHLNSAMIRIDVDHPDAGKPYSVPKDNPFVNTPGARPEIWAYGFRNPWRMAFDRKNGQLWVGQNGQDSWEQVYVVKRGENYGWSRFEGGHPFILSHPAGPTPVTLPVADHSHSEMRSLTGGVVYRGTQLPELDGAFVYGDWSTGRIWGIKYDGSKVTYHRELARTSLQITGFREMANGDLLVIDHGGGFYKLTPAPKDAPQPAFPRKLSQTGLFASVAGHKVAPGLVPYAVNSPLWSDGAAKERFIALPPGKTMEVSLIRGWDLPEGAVLVKTFSLDDEAGARRRIETRLFTKQGGQWAGYTYVWNDQQTEATLVESAGLDKPYTVRDPAAPGGKREQVWHFPSRTECMVCHTRASNFVLGINTIQLNRDFDYERDGKTVRDNQLRELEHLGLLRVDYLSHMRKVIRSDFANGGKSDKEADKLMLASLETRLQRDNIEKSSLLPLPPEKLNRLANPYDAHADLDLRARSYLHANCAICHVEAGGGNARINLEYGVDRPDMRVVDVPPQHASFDLAQARVVAPGSPEASVLFHRVTIRGAGQMPPLASSRVDTEAVQMLKEWIAGMKSEKAAVGEAR